MSSVSDLVRADAGAPGARASGVSVRWSPLAPYAGALAVAAGLVAAGSAAPVPGAVRAGGILLALAVALLFTGLRVTPPRAARRGLALGLVPATLFLIFAGAKVTSHQAGLAVPDWPLSYGRLMPPMVGNIFYEHGHRMIATAVGMATLLLVLWTVRLEERAWVRTLALACLGAVVAQGLLGGLTVLLLLPLPVSVAHGTLAQTFLCLAIWLVYATSREWRALASGGGTAGPGHPAARATAGPLRLAGLAAGAIWIQLVLGALVRHAGAGLAVPFFPVSRTGALVPRPVDGDVVLHMLHRGFALVVVALVVAAAVSVARRLPDLRRHAAALAGLVLVQFALGATVVLVRKAPTPTSVHVVTGAALLGLTFWLCLRVWRRGAPAPADARGVTALAAR